MIVSQDDIDAALTTAEAAVRDIADATLATGRSAPVGDEAAPEAVEEERVGARPNSPTAHSAAPMDDHRIRRILNLSVPVIVQLAARKMRVHEIVQWGRGAIVEFNQPFDAPLDLFVNNQRIGCGEAVKVGENFGLRITTIDSPETRLRAASKSPG
ncbi:MAG: FliM/FliN family flagellar motor switch protein [Phycisphaerae bacterium]|nr:FliM/FliN family flagellar motor switch protein [Phycisphaerae bacterium]NUQ46454.1 FliM/FliN family flagellar motor switch protein [Phycisphaerae bacterium]